MYLGARYHLEKEVCGAKLIRMDRKDEISKKKIGPQKYIFYPSQDTINNTTWTWWNQSYNGFSENNKFTKNRFPEIIDTLMVQNGTTFREFRATRKLGNYKGVGTRLSGIGAYGPKYQATWLPKIEYVKRVDYSPLEAKVLEFTEAKTKEIEEDNRLLENLGVIVQDPVWIAVEAVKYPLREQFFHRYTEEDSNEIRFVYRRSKNGTEPMVILKKDPVIPIFQYQGENYSQEDFEFLLRYLAFKSREKGELWRTLPQDTKDRALALITFKT